MAISADEPSGSTPAVPSTASNGSDSDAPVSADNSARDSTSDDAATPASSTESASEYQSNQYKSNQYEDLHHRPPTVDIPHGDRGSDGAARFHSTAVASGPVHTVAVEARVANPTVRESPPSEPTTGRDQPDRQPGEGPPSDRQPGDGQPSDGQPSEGQRDEPAAPGAAGGHGDADGASEPKPRPPDAVLALDIGGSGFSAGIVTMQGELIDRSDIGVDREAGPQSQLTKLAAIVDEQIERAERHHRVQLRAVGIASNGPIDQKTGTVSPNSLPMWHRFALRDHVAELTSLPTFLELDARALALAEGWLSAARGLSNFAVIVVSTSVEGALVIDGELVDGASHHAGQIGHVIVNSGGRRCSCGSRGCLEAEASSLAIEALTGRSASEPTYEIMQRTGRYVGRAAANVCNALDIGLVVVGGSVAIGFAATFFNAAQEELDRLSNLRTGKPRITRTKLGSQGTLVGAGAVGIRGLRRSRRHAAV